MDRVRARIGDKRVLALVKAFLKAGILGEDRVLRDTSAGTPQGSILSPLSNVALSVLDEHIAPPRCASRATATGAHRSPLPGQAQDEDRPRPHGACGAPGALNGARRVREAARRNGPAERPEPRPGPTSHPPQPLKVVRSAGQGSAIRLFGVEQTF
jgi:hypothetical protein